MRFSSSKPRKPCKYDIEQNETDPSPINFLYNILSLSSMSKFSVELWRVPWIWKRDLYQIDTPPFCFLGIRVNLIAYASTFWVSSDMWTSVTDVEANHISISWALSSYNIHVRINRVVVTHTKCCAPYKTVERFSVLPCILCSLEDHKTAYSALIERWLKTAPRCIHHKQRLVWAKTVPLPLFKFSC